MESNNYTMLLERIKANIEKVIIGKPKTINQIINSIISNGHVLIEDVPGIGKTTLISAVAKTINLSFKRIQFTPDILPADITGFTIYNPKQGDFQFRHGTVMSQIVLADEINRASPKTQSSMLEVMEERQVTVDGVTYKLPDPFIVFATQNPIEYLGTYPLPEAQLDRFLMKISVGYPSQDDEIHILSTYQKSNPLESLSPVADASDIQEMQRLVREVHVDESLKAYIVQLVSATRNMPDVLLGCSPRAAIALMRASQANAFILGRSFVIPEDIKNVIVSVLSHRLVLSREAKLKNITEEKVINTVLSSVFVPVVK